jgi:hypothetical protein
VLRSINVSKGVLSYTTQLPEINCVVNDGTSLVTFIQTDVKMVSLCNQNNVILLLTIN